VSEEIFDYIVVGAGSAGCVMAARLSEDGKANVLLLEAGGRDDHIFLKMPLAFLKAIPHPKFNWTYWTEPEPHLGGRRMPLPRGRVMGGSGSINGMFVMRGHPKDYDQWAQMGARGWSFADVLPYFRKLEDSWRGEGTYHGTGGPVAIRPIVSPYLLHEEMMATIRTTLQANSRKALPGASSRSMRADGGLARRPPIWVRHAGGRTSRSAPACWSGAWSSRARNAWAWKSTRHPGRRRSVPGAK